VRRRPATGGRRGAPLKPRAAYGKRAWRPPTGGVLNITAAVWSAGFHWWRSGNKKRTQNISEYMLVLALCLVRTVEASHYTFGLFSQPAYLRASSSPVWRVRGKIIRSVLCNIVRNSCAQCNAHTHTVVWIGFCLTGPISLCLDSFLCMYVFCISLYIACICRIVTW